MIYDSLITADELVKHLTVPGLVVVDCRFSLQDTDLGRRNYLASHITGAVYAHLDDDLSAPVIPGVTGRHPLPTPDAACQVLSNLGIEPGSQVVAYDDLGGALAAVRLWWILRWLGHEAVAVLDGGWQEWVKRPFPVNSGSEFKTPRQFIPHVHPEMTASAVEVDDMRRDPGYVVLDARSSDRYRGENETIDPVAGHIPGAISAPYSDNLNPDGTFRSVASLRTQYKRLLDGISAEKTVVYCGSGVTAVHNILAMVYAGLGESRLYPGSWSEWILDPNRPVTISE